MESVLLKGKFGKLKKQANTGSILTDKRGCRTVKVMATRPYYIRATFPPLRHFSTFLLERHHCIHRLINHVYTKETQAHSLSLPHDSKHNWQINSELKNHCFSSEFTALRMHQPFHLTLPSNPPQSFTWADGRNRFCVHFRSRERTQMIVCAYHLVQCTDGTSVTCKCRPDGFIFSQ